MADFVPPMPSEDEDFDAVLAPVRQRKPRTRKQPVTAAEVPQPEVTAPAPAQSVPISVPVESADIEEEPAYEVPAETAQEAAYANDSPEPEPEAAVEQTEAPRAPEYVAPFSQAVATAEAGPAIPRFQAARTSVRSVSPRLITEIVLALAVISLGLWSWQLYTDRQTLQTKVTTLQADPQLAVKQQADDLIHRIGQLMTLPTGETPTIASVSDVNQARQQSAFFNNAQNGDKVLMYVKAGEAILYRPSTNKIILVAPLTFNNGATDSAGTAVTTRNP